MVLSLNLSAQLLADGLLRGQLLELIGTRVLPAGWRLQVEIIDQPLSPSNQLLRTIHSMALDLGLSTTAEGVETEAQRRWLLDNGCLYAQGYLFGRPMPLGETIAWLRGDRPAVVAAGSVRPSSPASASLPSRLRGALQALMQRS